MNKFTVQVKERGKTSPMFYATDTIEDANRFAAYYRKNKYKYPEVIQKTLNTMKKSTYYVVVGNVGTMEYTSKKLAIGCYTTYVTMSKQNITSAAGESVTLFQDDNIIMEHIGSIDIE